MVFQPKSSLLSLSQPASTKQGEQYKNYKVFTHIQTKTKKKLVLISGCLLYMLALGYGNVW